MSALPQTQDSHVTTALNGSTSTMAAMSLRLLNKATGGILAQDTEQAIDAIQSYTELHALGRLIDGQIHAALSNYSSSPEDLRKHLCAMRMAVEYMRVGDLAKNIAERSLTLSTQNYPSEFLLTLRQMSELANGQLRNVVSAMDLNSAELAHEVWRDDQHLDAVYSSGFRQLLTYMMEDSRTIGVCTQLLFISKNLERAGDHATNLAELFLEMKHGIRLTEERPKRDTSSTLLFRS